jgi:hypothetical protein
MLPTLLAAAAAAPGETTSEKETGRCHRRESERHTGTETGRHTYIHMLGELSQSSLTVCDPRLMLRLPNHRRPSFEDE